MTALIRPLPSGGGAPVRALTVVGAGRAGNAAATRVGEVLPPARAGTAPGELTTFSAPRSAVRDTLSPDHFAGRYAPRGVARGQLLDLSV